MIVEEQKIRPRVVRDGDVCPAVVVEVREHHTHTFGFGLADTGSIAHVGEGTVMVVMEELCFLPLVVVWMTVGAVARPVLSAPGIILRTPFDVVADHEVQEAVLVVVEPASAGGPSIFVGHACLGRDVRESSLAVIVIENGTAVARDVEVRKAVVVKIAHRHALAVVALPADSGFFRDVGKGSVTIVVVEC